jgi:hypothetical protein
MMDLENINLQIPFANLLLAINKLSAEQKDKLKMALNEANNGQEQPNIKQKMPAAETAYDLADGMTPDGDREISITTQTRGK